VISIDGFVDSWRVDPNMTRKNSERATKIPLRAYTGWSSTWNTTSLRGSECGEGGGRREEGGKEGQGGGRKGRRKEKGREKRRELRRELRRKEEKGEEERRWEDKRPWWIFWRKGRGRGIPCKICY
jgi:hypothetical protein